MKRELASSSRPETAMINGMEVPCRIGSRKPSPKLYTVSYDCPNCQTEIVVPNVPLNDSDGQYAFVAPGTCASCHQAFTVKWKGELL